MWELIRTNKRNSILLMTIMASVLLALGGIIGLYVVGPEGVPFGLAIALAIWLILTLVSFSAGDQILLSASRAKLITHDIHPQLFNVVEEMKIAAGLPMPKIYLIDDPAPNAFATGRKPENASIAVTAGLLEKLNRDELQGVIAHEMSHILHRDILFVTLAGIMLGSIVILSQVFLRGMFYSSMGGRRRRVSSSGRGSGQAQLVIALIAILAAILAPIMAHILYFAISRKREYLADAAAARLTRYPEGLASALEKISGSAEKMDSPDKVTAPMYIVNPLQSTKRKLSGLGSTHPPTSQRIKVLRNMAGGSYNDYAQSYSRVTGSRERVLPAAALHDKQPVPKRQGQAESAPAKSQKDQIHRISDLVRMANGFAFLACVCGLKMKIPPNYRKESLTCPRCKRPHNIAKEAQKNTAK